MSTPENPQWTTIEGRRYLNFFRSLEPTQFAMIKVGGELIDDPAQLEPLAQDLAALHRLGLYPVVVHGGGPQINRALEQTSIPTQMKNGERVTSDVAAQQIPQVLADVNAVLCDAVNAASSKESTQGITRDVLAASLLDPEDFGSVDRIYTNTAPIVEAIEDKALIPIVSCAGNLAVFGGSEILKQSVNINGDRAAAAIAGDLAVEKFISLTSVGAVLDQNGNPLSSLSRIEANELIDQGVIEGGMGIKVRQAMRLFEVGVHDIVITSPAALQQELFTSSGHGTIIYEPGI